MWTNKNQPSSMKNRYYVKIKQNNYKFKFKLFILDIGVEKRNIIIVLILY